MLLNMGRDKNLFDKVEYYLLTIIIEIFIYRKIDEDPLMHWNPKKGQLLNLAKSLAGEND